MKIINELEKSLVMNDGDLDILFEEFISRYVYTECNKNFMFPKLIQLFMKIFNENVLNVLEYDFDTESGFSIIIEGKLEIFIYQLAKLNLIAPQLSDWMEIPFSKMEIANKATDKWAGETYKQVLQEIEITQKYFDRCYDEPYVKHFYSEDDIEKFKNGWRPHIKK